MTLMMVNLMGMVLKPMKNHLFVVVVVVVDDKMMKQLMNRVMILEIKNYLAFEYMMDDQDLLYDIEVLDQSMIQF
jgi:hypothetical protein